MYRIIDAQLKQPLFSHFDEFATAALWQDKTNSLHGVLAVSLRANSIGQAFAVAYRCALQALLPELDAQQWAAMCVTEPQGNHPKHIQSQVTPAGLVSGHKSFVTMAELSRQLIVIAKSGETQGGRPVLKAVLLQQPAEGISLQVMDALKLLPDVGHGKITLENAQGTILPGDGHNDYSKRFRHLEDVHILMAFVTLMFSLSVRYKLSPLISEKCLLLMSSLLGQELAGHSWQHLQLTAAFAAFAEIVAQFEGSFDSLPEPFKRDWLRDQKIFSVANKARLARSDKARSWLQEYALG
ncbi:MAG: hypothetical protein RPR98_00005 [Bermanella sp.]